MKKLLLNLLAIMACFTVSAQRDANISTAITSPAVGTTLTIGNQFSISYVITNLGPATISPTDTVLWVDPTTPAGQVFFITNRTKAANDTFQINRTLTLTSAPNGPFNWCVVAQPLNRSNLLIDSDTTNNRNCRNYVISGGTTGIGTLSFARDVESTQLNISPNPAQVNISLDFKARNNSAVIIRVMDITGRVIMNENKGAAYPGKAGYEMNISSLPNGLYIIEATQEGVKSVGRFNKM